MEKAYELDVASSNPCTKLHRLKRAKINSKESGIEH